MYYILLLFCLILALWAQHRVNSTFRKYDKIRNHAGYTGAQAAGRILRSKGLENVRIRRIEGKLTDYYDSRKQVVALSDSTADSDSVAAIAVAAHECGHAVQHKEHYLPLKIRDFLVPIANFGSRFSFILIILGLIFGYAFIQAGIVLFAAVAAFELITLPIEFNASERGLQMLENNSLVYDNEKRMVKKVLSAAAMTYVANTLTAIIQLGRLIRIYGRKR